MMAILSSVKWYLIVVLICISLMARDTEHPFIRLWALCIFILEKCLFRSFAHVLIELLVFQEWSHVSSLYILEIKPLSKVSLANIFSHMVGSLFIFLMFSLAMKKVCFCLFVHLFVCLFACFFGGDKVLFVYSFLYVHCSQGHISENITAWDI